MAESDVAVRRVFPRPAWFADLAASHDLSHLLSEKHGVKSKECEASCILLANVSRGAEYDGPLTQWSREDDLFWEHLGKPRDAFTENVYIEDWKSNLFAAAFRCLVVANPQRKKIPFWLPNVPRDVGNLQGFWAPDSRPLSPC